jgi:chromosome segregation ATPase
MSIDVYSEMVEAGNAEIASLSEQVKDIDRRIAELEQEQTTLRAAAEQRSAAIVQARLAVVQAEAKYNEAAAYAKLASRKPNEQQAIKAVSTARKSHESAKKELARLEKEENEQRPAADAREAEINKQLSLLRSEKETCFAQIKSVQSGRDKAHAEMGELLYAQLMGSYRAAQSRVDELAESLVEAKADLHDRYTQGLQQLGSWPELHRAFARLEVADDATTQVLETSLLYVDVMIADLLNTNDTPPLPSLKNNSPLYGGYHQLRPELLIHQADVISVLQRSPQNLMKRRARLAQLLTEYRAYLAERGV